MDHPFWSDDEDDFLPKAVKFKMTEDEMPDAVISDDGNSNDYDSPAYAAPDMPALPNEDDPEIPEDRVLNATPDPILDEPEWGTKKDAPRFSGKSVPRVWGESEPFTRRFNNESGTLKNS